MSIIRLLAGNSEELLVSEGLGANSELLKIVEFFNGTHEAMEIILQHCWPPIGNRPHQERLELAMALGGPLFYVKPVTFRLLLGRESWDSIICTQADYWRKQLILRIGYHLGSALDAQEEEDADEWRVILAVALKATDDLLDVMCDCMVGFVCGCFRHTWREERYSNNSIIERLRTGFHAWVSLLFEQGMDDESVEEIGKTLLSKRRSVSICWNYYNRTFFYISWLAWGPKREDWRAWWQEEPEEEGEDDGWVDDDEHVAAEFWNMTEHPERLIPGAWNWDD